MASLDDAEDMPAKEWPPTLLVETKIVAKMFRTMRDDGVEIGAQFVGIRPNDERWIYMLQDLMRDMGSKDVASHVMAKFISKGCKEALLIAEAWMSDTPEGYAWRVANPDKMMQEYEHAIEALFITHYSISGDTMAMAKIENGNLGKFRVKRALTTSGRFSNLFLRAQELNRDMN